jgi:hypothetical protein
VLVVVIVVRGVPVPIVDIIDMVIVRYGGVPASLGVGVFVHLGRRVYALDAALVVVVSVAMVGVPVVQVVDMVTMCHDGVPASLGVGVLVPGVRAVLSRGGHSVPSSIASAIAGRTMCAMCASCGA